MFTEEILPPETLSVIFKKNAKLKFCFGVNRQRGSSLSLAPQQTEQYCNDAESLKLRVNLIDFNLELISLIYLLTKKKISRSDSVKYLGVWIDDKLNWSAHINALSLQLAKHCSMLYHIRDFVPHYAPILLYYSFIYSCVNYGITTWGTADQSKKHEIEVKTKNIVRTITWNKKFTHVSHLYQNLNLLNLNDIYKLELANFMHKLYNNNLPIVFQNRFTKIEKIHTYVTREANKLNYFLS